jgi:diacylglycerol kinase (ATP)
MRPERPADRPSKSVDNGLPRPQAALPGRGGLARIASAFWNSLGGLQEGLSTESAIKQEVAIACLLLPLSFFIARDVWTWVALVGSLLFVLSIEFLNTAIERLCNHIQPDRHEAIRITKDLASAGVFFSLALAGIVWIAALWSRFVN